MSTRCALAGDGKHDCSDPTRDASCRPGALSPLEDRRQRAREAYHDAPGGHATYPGTRLDIAIETATRVRITDEAARAMYLAGRGEPRTPAQVIVKGRVRLAAALRELGFEVEE